VFLVKTSSNSNVEKSVRYDRAVKILNLVKINKFESWRIITEAETFYKNLLDFAIKEAAVDGLQKEQKGKYLILPLKKYIYPKLPKKGQNTLNFNPFPANPVFITQMGKEIKVMPSKEKPKRIYFHCTDNKKVYFLLKYEPK